MSLCVTVGRGSFFGGPSGALPPHTHSPFFFFFFPGGSLVFGSARLAVNHRLGQRLAAMFDLAQPFIRYAHGGEVKVIYQKLQLESEEEKKTQRRAERRSSKGARIMNKITP